MKVLVASRLPPWSVGGLETYLRTLATSAKEDGRCVMEFVFCPVGDRPSDGEVGDYATLHAAPIRSRTQQLAYKMASRPRLQRLLELFITAKMRGSLDTLSKRGDISAVHFVGTGWDLSGFALSNLAKQLHVPFTICPFTHPDSWGDDSIDLRLYRGACAVFCQTKFEAEHLVSRGIQPEKLVLAGQAPAVALGGNRKLMRQQLQLGDSPCVLFLGRRDEGKGYPALLKAWKLVLRRFPSAVLILAGSGGHDYDNLSDDLPVESLRDLGVVSADGKSNALAACDVFCLPSAHESFGIVYVEAWAYAKPVICGTAPACRELIKNGATGLHASQDPEILAERICELLVDSRRAAEMGAAGEAFQRMRYSREKLFTLHLQTWRSAIGHS